MTDGERTVCAKTVAFACNVGTTIFIITDIDQLIALPAVNLSLRLLSDHDVKVFALDLRLDWVGAAIVAEVEITVHLSALEIALTSCERFSASIAKKIDTIDDLTTHQLSTKRAVLEIHFVIFSASEFRVRSPASYLLTEAVDAQIVVAVRIIALVVSFLNNDSFPASIAEHLIASIDPSQVFNIPRCDLTSEFHYMIFLTFDFSFGTLFFGNSIVDSHVTAILAVVKVAIHLTMIVCHLA